MALSPTSHDLVDGAVYGGQDGGANPRKMRGPGLTRLFRCNERTLQQPSSRAYSCAVIVPVISGFAWDMTGSGAAAFVPIAFCGIVLAVLAPAINHVRRPGA